MEIAMPGDFDTRDLDARERDDGIHDREDQWLVLGREQGLAAPHDQPVDDERERGDDRREERDREPRDRDDDPCGLDPRDVFMRDLDLPDSRERELVHHRDRDYSLNGSDTRALSTIGAFRVVPERDLRDPRDASFDERSDLRHLEKQGLIERVPLDGRDRAAVLTERGRSILEAHRRDRDPGHRQTFHAGADRARERTHDAQLYRAYLKEAERLRQQEARILRVQLDRELKREYQRFLQERNRGDRDSDGRPDRSPEEIEDWAREHDLPYYNDQVHFPDVRIEYEDVDGDVRHRDVEVTTEHYRGGHASSASRSGFAVYRSGGVGSGASPFDPGVAEDFL
jgi:DNA-binding MarR family transcriptional regulator